MYKTINKLDCYVVNPGASKAVVLLHGFGADRMDLAPLAQLMDPDSQWTWIFPDAPKSLSFGGRAWFHIDMEELQRAMMTGQLRDYSQSSFEEQEPELLQMMQQFRDTVCDEYDTCVFGGFSQGGMVCSHLLVEKPKNLVGALLMSTALLDKKRLSKGLEQSESFQILQSHGIQDPVLHLKQGEQLRDVLKKEAWTVDWTSFTGQHEIPMDVLQKATAFLKQW